MASLRVYRLTSTQVNTAVGTSSTTIVAKGKIIGISYTCGAVSGATSGRITSEIAFNNTANSNAETATGAPSENVICRVTLPTPGTNAGAAPNQVSSSGFTPFNRSVEPGNTLCVNTTQTGTSPSSAIHAYDVYVQE